MEVRSVKNSLCMSALSAFLSKWAREAGDWVANPSEALVPEDETPRPAMVGPLNHTQELPISDRSIPQSPFPQGSIASNQTREGHKPCD